MTHEERFGRIEQKLEFLGESQARIWANLQELQQIGRLHSEQIRQHSAQIAEIGSFILRLGRVVEEGRETRTPNPGGIAAAPGRSAAAR